VTPRTPGTLTGMPLPPLVAPGAPLDRGERERYARHLLIPALGDAGQRRLRAARVCVVGAGGLGSPALLYLAAAGVGHLTIVDDDVVDVSNLQRQVIHPTAAVGTPKVRSAAAAVRAVNPGVEVTERGVRLTPDNAAEVLAGHDVVLDGTDNFPTRYVVDDACASLAIPSVWASVYRTQAQVAVFWASPPPGAVGVTLRDLFPEPPDPATVPSCGDAGVLGALCGQVGSMMAAEVIKLVCGVGEPLLGRVAFVDLLDARVEELPLAPRPRPAAAAVRAASSGGASSGGAASSGGGEASLITPRGLADALASGRPPIVVDVREPAEVALAAIEGSVRIPLADFLESVPTFPADATVVVHCKVQPRAALAARALVAAGHPRVQVLAGGILAWIDEVEPTLVRY